MHVEHLRVPVGTGQLHVERVGRGGPAVVLLHGFGTCAFLWRNIAPPLANAGFTVLSVDMLGHGESDRPPDASYSLPSQAEYLDRTLTALRISSAVIVAQDLSCIPAVMLAARRPSQIRRLVLLSPVDPENLPPRMVRTLQRSSARAAISANDVFGAMPLVRTMLESTVDNPARMSERLIARYGAPFIGSDGVEHLLLLASASELASQDQFEPQVVSTDTLLIHGTSDRWISATDVERFAARLSGATTQIESLPGVGHLVAEDAPELLVRILLSSLAQDAFEATAAERRASYDIEERP